MPSKKRRRILDITAATQSSNLILKFSDTGPGIRDPHRVFDPFYTTKPVGKGTGLGLSAVYGVIQDHGGQITCRNKPEGGAEFTIRLPLSLRTIAQGAGASSASEPFGIPVRPRGEAPPRKGG